MCNRNLSYACQDHDQHRQRRKLSTSLSLVLILSVLTPVVGTNVQAADPPTPLSPTQDAYISAVAEPYNGHASQLVAPPLAIPEFSWSVVQGTSNYRIQFSQNINFSPISYEVTTPNTTYTPTNAEKFPDGNLYWRVRVDSPQASEFSQPVLYIKDWASPNNAPGLTSPANDAALDFYSAPVFSWEPVVGAAAYRFQIASSEGGFGSPLYSEKTLAFSHQPKSKLANGLYYWRVVPLDPYDRDGTPSEVRSFYLSYGSAPAFTEQIPQLIEPSNGSFPTFTPTFRWTAVRGAEKYRLEYTTDPTCDFGVAGYTTVVESRNTMHTPTNAFPNDKNYCWRVRAHSGYSVSEWSPVWEFEKRWNIQPILLTPTNLYQYVKTPYFSWTPVPGASRYRIEVNLMNSFPPIGGSNCQFSKETGNTHYFHLETPVCVPDDDDWYYWRVTPIDRNGNAGSPSEVGSFKGGKQSPQLISPLYYYSYPPAQYPDGADLTPHEERAIAYPVFQWHRLLDDTGTNQHAAYRVEVNQDNPFLDAPEWSFETENLSAVPTLNHPFTPLSSTTDYYWRVRPLSGLGGNEVGHWSQTWLTRFDSSKALTPTQTINLLRPVDGYEFVETNPLLEWWPLEGADSYEVRIYNAPPGSPDSVLVDSEMVPYPGYSPPERLDYYPNDAGSDLGYGTFYWQVRGLSGGSYLGGWSEPGYFLVAAQSNWQASRTLGTLPGDSRQIAYDPSGDVDPSGDLVDLLGAQTGGINEAFWYFGFTVPSTETKITYALYLDLDHQAGSGGTSDAEGINITTGATHRPEYALYVHPNGGDITAGDVSIYGWQGNSWGFPVNLNDMGGDATWDEATNYLEFRVPDTAIGMGAETGSAALSLFCADETTGNAVDSVPSGSLTTLERFATVSGKLTLAMPANNLTGDPTTLPTVLPFSWQLPIDVPWYGYRVQVGVDPSLTTWLFELKVWGGALVYPDFTSTPNSNFDFNGDNTYYWRVQPLYEYGVPEYLFGAWSQVGRFEREGFVPQNLTESVDFATPTFSWDRVEGAEAYDIQVDSDPSFNSPEFSTITTPQTSFTPGDTLANGTYYWRVRARRFSSITNDWSSAKSFSLNLPLPSNLTPDDPNPEHATRTAPTFCWDALIASASGYPVVAAWKYRVQVSRDSAFGGNPYDGMDTEQNCWTPIKGYEDGTYYWRVAMIDGNSRLANYSPAAQFTKQYPLSTEISPPENQLIQNTPTFVWSPVDGAASYKLEISLYQTFSPLYDSVTTNNTRYTPTKIYEPGHYYYWRVAMVDRDGRIGPFTGTPYLYSNLLYLPQVISQR